MAGLLEVKGLRAFYGATQALFGVDFGVEVGKITALLGANGAGKTTVLRAICQMVRTSGSIVFDSQELSGKATESIVRRGIAHVPEGRGTFAALTVEENLRLGAITRRDWRAVAEDIAKIYRQFPSLGVRRQQQAGTLSGGEQQMLAISRALMLRPRLLLLDEPSFGLAPLVVTEIFEIMREINQTDQVSMLLVEQNASVALEISHNACLLETGRVAVSGSSEQMQRDENVRHAYLGV